MRHETVHIIFQNEPTNLLPWFKHSLENISRNWPHTSSWICISNRRSLFSRTKAPILTGLSMAADMNWVIPAKRKKRKKKY